MPRDGCQGLLSFYCCLRGAGLYWQGGARSYLFRHRIRVLACCNADRRTIPSLRPGRPAIGRRVRTTTCCGGGAEGIRTPDLLTASQTRSQLRHGPTSPEEVMIPRTSDLTAWRQIPA